MGNVIMTQQGHKPATQARSAVLVMATGTQTLIVSFAERSDRIGEAALALASAGIGFTPVTDRDGEYAALMCFMQDGMPEGYTAHVAATLARAGFDAFGYEPFYDHDLGSSPAFIRVHPGSPSAPVFISALNLTEGGWDLWAFGPAERLKDAAEAADERGLAAQCIDGPDGVMAVEIEVRDDRDRAESVAWAAEFGSVPIHGMASPLHPVPEFDEIH